MKERLEEIGPVDRYRLQWRGCQTTSPTPLFPPLEIYFGPSNASIDGSYSSHLTRNGLLEVQTALSTMWQQSGGGQ
jgi:hypothetical protein